MIKLVCPQVKENPIRATECPLCRGMRLQIHDNYRKLLKDSVVSTVSILRMKCMNCSYTFRVYPEGVRAYSSRSKRLVFMGVVLYSAGLSYEKTVAIIEAFLGKSLENRVTVWPDIQRMGETLRRHHFGQLRRGESVVVGIDGGYFKVMGHEVCILFSVDSKDSSTILFDTKREENREEIKAFVRELQQSCYPEAIVTDDWELYKEEMERRNIAHQVCLAHMKKNFKRAIKNLPDTVPKPFVETLTSLVDNPTPEGILILGEYTGNPWLYYGTRELTQTR